MTHDQARDLALDPTTTAAQLAGIATSRPDLRALVAAHPQAYPSLLDWLRGLGDPAVVAAIDARSGAQASTQSFQPQGFQPQRDLQPQTGAPTGWSPGAQPPAGHAPAATAYGFGDARAAADGSPGYGSAGYGSAGYGSAGYGSTGYDMATIADEIPAAPRRRRGLVIAGAAAGTAIALGGAAFAVNHFVLDKVNGSETPRAAFEQLMTGLEKKDALAMLGAMSPAEVSSLSGIVDDALKAAEGSSSAASIKAFTDVLDSMTITTSGVTTTETNLQEGLSKVEVTAGTITVDGNPEKVGDAFVAAWEKTVAANPQLLDTLKSFGGAEAFDPQMLRAELVKQLEEALPATADFADFAREGQPLFVMTVEEGDGWYVSPYLSIGEIAYVASGATTPRGTMLGDGKGAGSGSPEAAGQGLVQAIVSGDVDRIIAALPLPERRALSVYMPAGETFDVPFTTSGSFTADGTTNGRSRLAPQGLTFASTEDGKSVTIDGTCVVLKDTESGKDGRICLDEAPLLNELGYADLGLVAVEEGGSWFVSPTETILDIVRQTSDAMAELQKSGKLDDEKWVQERTTKLMEYLAGQPIFADLATELAQGGFPGAALGGGGDLGSGFDDPSGLEGFDGEGDTATFDLRTELAHARVGVATYLVDHPEVTPNAYADGGASLLTEGGFTPSEGVIVTIAELEADTGTFCLVGMDLLGGQEPLSVDETGTIYESMTCS
ncbi:hypothetical protein [Sanguibacter sp. HDW7]|uniref:variant leucine-rich repeat-containing protein n=1 Tax=Sanguibacter sp. HDW7 TaxID=2714931 RepID=UPI0014079A1E|nr:hypothetical protein [Sanguibacter sp. HDW7]QIK83805.1 hypothetical protein G7063_09350 [Sanguibacter sp. HDW7]